MQWVDAVYFGEDRKALRLDCVTVTHYMLQFTVMGMMYDMRITFSMKFLSQSIDSKVNMLSNNMTQASKVTTANFHKCYLVVAVLF